jgi:DNA mismatch repair protein MutS2
MDLAERSRDALDWPALLAELAARAQSEAGRAACLALPLHGDAAEARRHMAAVEELAAILRRGESTPTLNVPEVGEILATAEKGLVLGPEEVRPVADLLAVAANVRRFVDDAEARGRGAPTPELDARAAAVDAQPGLARVLGETFDTAGEIRDSVSPALARLRRERAQLADGARAAIEALMRGPEYASVLQDRFVTVREDRYVLPVKASAKSMGLGIVHDTSRTGETVYVEPMPLVAANNRIKVAELEIRAESRRILEELTARVAAAASALRATAAALVELDVLAAAARLGVAYGGAAVPIVDEPLVDLRDARHPLLALRAAREGFALVTNDVALGGVVRARLLVVSGPNAGGKTVLLKTVALAALLARAGLLVPAAPASRVGFFAAVLADIGDQQSVAGDLSTFSGHLANVAAILRRTDEAAAGPALVLCDELMAGTNPEQGAALARATAEALGDRPGLAVLTTHYDSLKALADADPRFVNAGMEYDLTSLRPTFRLLLGTPGRSYALDIATRMEMPPALVERARALAGDASVGLEATIASLAAREAELAAEARGVAETRAALAEAEERQREAAVALERRERELGRHSREAVEAEVRQAREAIAAIVREAQRAGTSRAAADARAALAEAAAEALARLPKPAPSPPVEALVLAPGARVFVPSMGAEGVVARAADARGRVKVAVGSLTVELDAAELRRGAAAAAARRASAAGGPVRGSAPDELTIVIQNANNTLDLRGRRADDAVNAVETFLDRAALEGNSPVIIVHGHGTGALRKEVRAYLASSPYVARWAPGAPRQGGDGVSIVELR